MIEKYTQVIKLNNVLYISYNTLSHMYLHKNK